MSTPQLLIIPGSARTGSLNRMLAVFAGERARATGGGANVLDLRRRPCRFTMAIWRRLRACHKAYSSSCSRPLWKATACCW